MRRVLLDQGLAPQTAVVLRQHGFDAVHVSEIGIARAEDREILDLAGNDSRVCITLDHDFARIWPHPGKDALPLSSCGLKDWMRWVRPI